MSTELLLLPDMKEPKRKSRSELIEQICLIQWWDGYVTGNKTLKKEMLFHVPNEGARGAKGGKTMQRAGLRKGVPDLFLAYPAGKYSGLWIELKSAKGRLRPEQRGYLSILQDAGYAVAVCYGASEGIKTITDYIGSNINV